MQTFIDTQISQEFKTLGAIICIFSDMVFFF